MTSPAEARRQLKIGPEQILLAAVVVLAVLMYVPTFRFLWGKWMDEAQYSLGILAPIVSVGFAYQKLSAGPIPKRSPSVWGLALIALGVLMHLAGVVLDVKGPSGVSIIVLLVGACLYFHGPRLVRLLWFPLAYLVFMVPVPGGALDKVTFPMQLLATRSTEVMLAATGMDVTRSGITLIVEGHRYDVAPACSGMSSLVALIGVTAVFAYVVRLRPLLKWVLFACALPIALAANALRIATIGLVGYQWGQETALGIYHNWASPILFFIAILILFSVNWILERIDSLVARLRKARPPVDAAAPASDAGSETAPSRVAYTVVVALLVISTGITAWAGRRPPMTITSADLGSVPTAVGKWSRIGADEVQSKEVLDAWGVTAENFLERRYVNPDGESLTLIVVFKGRDRRNWHLSEMCYSGSGYEVRQSRVRMPYADGVDAVKLYAEDRNGGAQVAAYWFAAGRHTEGSFLRQQVSMALSRLRPRDEAGWAFVRVNAVVTSSEEETTASIRGFIKSLSGPLQRALVGSGRPKGG